VTIVLKSGSFNFLEPSVSVQVFIRIDLPLALSIEWNVVSPKEKKFYCLLWIQININCIHRTQMRGCNWRRWAKRSGWKRVVRVVGQSHMTLMNANSNHNWQFLKTHGISTDLPFCIHNLSIPFSALKLLSTQKHRTHDVVHSSNILRTTRSKPSHRSIIITYLDLWGANTSTLKPHS
jgi:hypothetical protein